MTAEGQMQLLYAGALAFLLVGLGVYLLVRRLQARAAVERRVKLALGQPRGARERRMAKGGAALKSSMGTGIASLGRMMPLGEKDRQKIVVSLQRAGYRSSNALATMLGIKFSCLVGGLAVGGFALYGTLPGPLGVVVALVGGLVVGVVLNVFPEMVLGRLASNRLRRIEAALPETFDLLVVCLESGLTFERALTRTVDNLKSIQPELAREFGRAVLDMSVHGRTREDALGRLANRVVSQKFRDLSTTVAQSGRQGTPLAEALRKLAGSARVEAISRMQEKMARLPTLLVIPSIACILPGILVIVGGPALTQLTQNLGNFGG